MTSTTATPGGRTLPGWLKTGLLAVFVFVLCWGAAIAWWRAGGSEPGAVELALVLLALPLGLIASWLGIRSKFAMPQPAIAKVGTASAAAQSAPVAPSVPPLAILASALRSPHGASPEELASAIAERKARPDLDSELIDDKGFPITAARRNDAVDDALQEELNAWLTGINMAELRFSDVQWRALTLGTAIVRDLGGEAASLLIPLEGTPPTLRLIAILPADWPLEQRNTVGMWFKHQVAQFGWPETALTCIDVQTSAGCVASAINQFARDAAIANQGLAALVMSCDSHIDQETVDQWNAAGLLLTSSRAQGLIPGEGAAGILLTSLQQAQTVVDAPYAVLETFLEGRHDVSIGESKGTSKQLLRDLVERTCKQANVESAEVAMVVADTGERANRMLELMGVVSTTFSHLDDQADVACVGASSGACGAVPCITALALARHHALERAAPVLYVGNEDPHHRCTVLIAPAAAA
ncbi:hypothetical protein [Massilia sp. SYSU DXS3249]